MLVNPVVLSGEVVAPAPPRLPKPIEAPEPGTWTVYMVDLPGHGRIEGMDRADALRLAAELGTKAYAAHARLGPNRVVVVSVPERIIR